MPLIVFTGRRESALARHADVHLSVEVDKEACPLNLAPTASTTATLALGDALAMALAEAKGFLLVSSSPLTRSSYHADADFARLRVARRAGESRG